MSRRELLFATHPLRQVMEHQLQRLRDGIEAMPEGQILGSNLEDLVQYFEERYHLDIPELQEGEIQTGQCETKLDVSQDPVHRLRSGGRPVSVPATRCMFFVPFRGDAGFFGCRPSTADFSPPLAEVRGTELIFAYASEHPKAQAVQADFAHDLDHVKRYLAWIAGDAEPFNSALAERARGHIQARRDRLLKAREAVTALGYPIRRRAGAPKTYAVPEVRRRLPPPPLPASDPATSLEPVLGLETYEHVLGVMSNMVTVMERSPAAFRTMGEEDIRQHFLVQLNGQYDGQATGETFNGAGKTDILIRVNGRNIFVAECKFWKGPKSFDQAIDQLMSYVTWRDTKTALVIFNRGRQLSAVLAKIPGLLRARLEFTREVRSTETTFCCLLTRRDDPGREVLLTVMVFDVPGESGQASGHTPETSSESSHD